MLIDEYKHELNKSKIRRINTLHSSEGCRRIKGKWDKKHNACVLREIEPGRYQIFGWTAPVHGAFVWWHLGDYVGEEESYGGEIGVANIEKCELYPDMPCTDPYDIYYENREYDTKTDLMKFYGKLKEKALTIASDIVQGKAHQHDIIYYNDKGEVSYTPTSRHDKIGRPPCMACIPVPPSIHKPEGFRLKKRK